MRERLVFIDLEMTGVSPPPLGTDRIIEIALLDDEGDWDSLVNPQRPCTPQATAVHGLTDEHLADAPLLQSLYPEILHRLQGCIAVGHGVSHDRAFLQAELPPDSMQSIEWIDTGRMAQRLLHLKRHTLSEVALALGVPRVGAHRASADAATTRAVFWALYERMGKPPLSRLLQPTRVVRPEVGEALREAFATNTPVRIEYDRGRGPVERTISITGFSGWSVSAFCHLRQADRTFHLDRIVRTV